MSISPLGSVTGNSTLQQLEALYQKMEAKLAPPTTPTASATSAAATDTDSVSGIGKLLSNLQDLATSDPAKFKQETGAIAAKLNDAAGNTAGDESSFFKDLASQFQQASDTGDASALAPKRHAHHNHASSGTNSSAANSSAADQYNSTSLFSMLGTDSSTSSNFLSGSQQTLLNNLFGTSNQ